MPDSGPGRTLRSRRRVEDDQDDGPGEDFTFDNVSQSSDEDDTQPITRAHQSRTPATSTPVAQVINDVTLPPVQVPTTADILFFFDKESADKVFCKICMYVNDLIHSFLQTNLQITGRNEKLTPRNGPRERIMNILNRPPIHRSDVTSRITTSINTRHWRSSMDGRSSWQGLFHKPDRKRPASLQLGDRTYSMRQHFISFC